MAGGPSTPKMVSTVANLGAVGSYGFAYSSADKIGGDLDTARGKLLPEFVGALNANFFIFKEFEVPDSAKIEEAIDDLNQITGKDLQITSPSAPYYPDLVSQLEPVWVFRPDIITFHFGIPDEAIIEKAHSLDIAVGINATSADEARKIEKASADFIVAQGIEAGGHRGIFDPQCNDPALSCFDLITTLSNVTKLPLVAAGGIMNSNHIEHALRLGATAVQMGTAFLSTHESGASQAHKDYLINQQDRSAELTWGFSGRPARGINNRFIREMVDKPVLPFPMQNSLTGKLRTTAVANNDGEFQSLWAGSNFSECRQESIDELVTRLFDRPNNFFQTAPATI